MDELEGSPTPNDQDENKVLTQPDQNSDSLSAETEELSGQSLTTDEDATTGSSSGEPESPKHGPSMYRRAVSKLNVYMVLYLVILVMATVIIVLSYLNATKNNNSSNSLKTQSLNQSTLDQLANSDATVGNSQQVLTVQSSAIFAGQVLVRGNLEVAGNIKLGGTISINNLSVTGTTQLATLQVNKNLAVAGNSSIQGSETIAKTLQVNGTGNFSGTISAPQVSTSNLQLTGNLTILHHIVTGGATPNRSSGSALGSGGTVAVSGSDTAGTININTGSNPGTGCFVTVNFNASFGTTPHVQVTPIGSSAGSLQYYVNRSSTSFSVCTNNSAPGQSSFAFDYFVIN